MKTGFRRNQRSSRSAIAFDTTSNGRVKISTILVMLCAASLSKPGSDGVMFSIKIGFVIRLHWLIGSFSGEQIQSAPASAAMPIALVSPFDLNLPVPPNARISIPSFFPIPN